MRVSNLLLAAMIATSYGSIAQESSKSEKLDPIRLIENEIKTKQVSIDNAFLKKVEKLYAKRDKRNKKKLGLMQKEYKSSRDKIESTTLDHKRPHFYCPSCGRG